MSFGASKCKETLLKSWSSKNHKEILKMNCPHYNALWWADLWLFFFHPPQQNIKRTKCHRGLLFYCPNDRIIDIHRLNQSSSFFVMFFYCHMDIINYYLSPYLSWSKTYQIETWNNCKLLMHTCNFVINNNFPFWWNPNLL